MSVLIVARTRMGGDHRCIGGLIVDESWKDNYLTSVRLLTANGNHFTSVVDFDVGEFWNVDFSYSNNTELPHSEDVRVYDSSFEQECDDLSAFLREHQSRLAELNRWWEGSTDAMFGGKLNATRAGTGYVSDADVSEVSTGFWVPDQDLDRSEYDGTVRYNYPGFSNVDQLKHVGTNKLPQVIPEGTICRVSLSRWYSPDSIPEEGYWLQLSGAYLRNEDASDSDSDDLPF